MIIFARAQTHSEVVPADEQPTPSPDETITPTEGDILRRLGALHQFFDNRGLISGFSVSFASLCSLLVTSISYLRL
jgi:hypothetical protein